MPQVGFEPTIPAPKRAKTFHASDRVATVVGGVLRGEIDNYNLNTGKPSF
jgi:hypothetical protein